MPLKKRKTALRAIGDQFRFLKSWAGNPLKTGAVAPSGPELTKAMAAEIDLELDGAIIELGPGTGVVTKALLARGIEAERIIAVEFNPDFVTLLRKRFPDIQVIEGDAYELRKTIGKLERKAAAVISSLPLFNQPTRKRQKLILDAFRLCRKGAPFIQFSYGLKSPIPKNSASMTITKSEWIMKNMPPARVWTYRNKSLDD